MSDFAVTITCKLNETDEGTTTFVLDTVRDTNITSSSTMTTHPIVTGDIVADHIYNNPDSLSISGSFSLNGSKGIVVNQNGAKLESVQVLFEKIKKEGLLCNIVKVHNDENKNIRFKLHENMVLTNISWTEKINSLDFTFTFTQALLSEIQEYEVKTDDAFLPDINQPPTLNFTDTLIDWDYIDKNLIKILIDENLITNEFLNFLSGLGNTALIALGVGAAFAIVLHAIGAATGPIGFIIGAAVGIVGGIAHLIINAIRRHKYRIEQFKKYDNDRENQKEVQRFANFEGEIHKQLNQLNNSIKVYNIGSNNAQECILSIDNNYYTFNFKRNNSTNYYSLTVTDIEENIVASNLNISSCPNNFSQLTSKNKLFRAAEGGSYIYIICPNEDTSNLTNYYIVTTSMNLDNYNEAISKIIYNALCY